MSNINAKRINFRQRERLLDLVERNKSFLLGNKSHGNSVKTQIWQHISTVLNELGSNKTADQWKKTWTDIKSAVKRKAIKLKALNSTFGSDFPIEMQLSEEDYKILCMCDSYIINDISEIPGALSNWQKTNSQQRRRFFELIEENISILSGPDTDKKMEKWSMISVSLNVLGDKKTSEQWRNVWLQMKKTVKRKIVTLKSAGCSEQLSKDQLTKEDQRVIRIYETEGVDNLQETEDLFSEYKVDNENITIDSVSSVQTVSETSRQSTKTESFQWKNHSSSIADFQKALQNNHQTCDITLAFKGKSVRAHRFILSACSNLFCKLLRDVPSELDATIIVPDIDGSLLDGLLNFIYMGETNIGAAKLTEFLEAISNLGIKTPISFECANITVTSKEPADAVEIEVIELVDDVKQEVFEKDLAALENTTSSQNNQIDDRNQHSTALDEIPSKSCTSLPITQSAYVDVLGEDMDIQNPFLNFGEEEYNPKRPRIEKEFRDKVDCLRAEQRKSLKSAHSAHLQEGMSLQKAAIKFKISELDRRLTLGQLELEPAAPQAKTLRGTTMFSSSDDDDEEARKTFVLRLRKHIRTKLNPLDLPDIKFKKLFKMSKEAFVYLLDVVRDKLPETTCSSAVPPILKLAATLQFLVEGAYQKDIDNEFKLGLAQPTLSKVLGEVLLIIENHICPQWIKFEYTEEEKRQAKLFFYQQAGIPGVIGCVVGTHIKIISPSQYQRKYYNKMGFHSINAMIVCDHRMKIRFVDSSHPGSVHESVVWKSSKFRKALQQNYCSGEKNTWLLGDSRFPLEPFLITPFRSEEQGSKEDNFNKKHSKTKEIIERTIVILKKRFQCLIGERPLYYSPQKARQIINVCIALHNICLEYKSDLPVDQNDFDLASTAEVPHVDDASVTIEDDKKAENIRDQVVNAILTI